MTWLTILFGVLVYGLAWGVWWIIDDCVRDVRWWRDHPPPPREER